MASLNELRLIGNVGKEPELRYTAANKAVCNFGLATTDRWKDADSGELREKTQWHSITVWGKQAENVAKFVKKGDLIFVAGSIEYGSYKNKEGVDIPTTTIVCENVQFLEKPSKT